eukprot:252737-Prymnesium_polylepis.1
MSLDELSSYVVGLARTIHANAHVMPQSRFAVGVARPPNRLHLQVFGGVRYSCTAVRYSRARTSDAPTALQLQRV